MLFFLRALFVLVIVSMLGVTSWASLQCPLFAVPRDVATHPWFIATLLDAYWGFITFFIWVGCKQTAWGARACWLTAILLLGNIAMAAFCLRELFRIKTARDLPAVLTRPNPGQSALGLGLAGLGLTVVGLAALS